MVDLSLVNVKPSWRTTALAHVAVLLHHLAVCRVYPADGDLSSELLGIGGFVALKAHEIIFCNLGYVLSFLGFHVLVKGPLSLLIRVDLPRLGRVLFRRVTASDLAWTIGGVHRVRASGLGKEIVAEFAFVL